MKRTASELSRTYAAELQAYLDSPAEPALHRAYELGRQTMASGLGVMELAQAHHRALLEVLVTAEDAAQRERRSQLSTTFFLESLWPFAAMHRGFLETNLILRQTNQLLEHRAQQLAKANAELQSEIAERERVESALRHSEESLRRLSRQVLYAQEEERKRISRELHDEVGQALTAIHMSLSLLAKLPLPPPGSAKVQDLQKFLHQTMETVHDFTSELRPAMLDDLGLVPALRAYIRNFGKRTGLRVRFSSAGEIEGLGIEAKTVLYRVTQEGLNNVAKHARARHARVILRNSDGKVRMEVQDDGRAGFPVRRANGRLGLGLLGIRERVRLVNGAFSLESQAGKGTTIRVEIPFKFGGAKSN